MNFAILAAIALSAYATDNKKPPCEEAVISEVALLQEHLEQTAGTNPALYEALETNAASLGVIFPDRKDRNTLPGASHAAQSNASALEEVVATELTHQNMIVSALSFLESREQKNHYREIFDIIEADKKTDAPFAVTKTKLDVLFFIRDHFDLFRKIYFSDFDDPVAEDLFGLNGSGGEVSDIRPPLFLAAFHGDHDLVEYLLTKGADPLVRYRPTQSSVLLHISKRTSPETLRLLIEHGAKVKARSANSQQPLHQVKTVAQLKVFLEHGADLNVKNNLRQTPLHFYIQVGDPDLILLALSRTDKPFANAVGGISPYSHLMTVLEDKDHPNYERLKNEVLPAFEKARHLAR